MNKPALFDPFNIQPIELSEEFLSLLDSLGYRRVTRDDLEDGNEIVQLYWMNYDNDVRRKVNYDYYISASVPVEEIIEGPFAKQPDDQCLYLIKK